MELAQEKEAALRSLAAQLIMQVDEVALRGTGNAVFIYVIGNGRSAEISFDEDDRFWVQYWDSLDEDADPVAEFTYEDMRRTKREVLARLI